MDIGAALKQVFGYDAFRPLQEEIVRKALAGKDIFATLPTGAGKSLCFQLPALLPEEKGVTVVVSPLIALMKDQVDSLQAMGAAATFLNSSLSATEQRERLLGVEAGDFRLLYVSPERLMMEGFLKTLKKADLSRFAIDEAHCISEWGHDFRPEYRKLSELRRRFPKVPIMALTATATERVREDILQQLDLQDTECFLASFNRPNLSYQVVAKDRPLEQAVSFVQKKAKESGIIYCLSRKTTEQLAQRLSEEGITARPYHAGLSAKQRAENQEAFLRDEVQVICATIAFGMGIDKPNVRFVLHYDLPKNIEGYYQETGRAGRDGLPGECCLLFRSSDAVKLMGFIQDMGNEQEQRTAEEHLRQMIHYAEDAECRRVVLLRYFGEVFSEENCGSCDNCLSPRETFDGTLAAQKFLSCMIRIRQATPQFGVGLNYIAGVLRGSQSKKIKHWGHDSISTYGIGEEFSLVQWKAIGRELIRLGLCAQTQDQFSVLQITQEGRDWLKKRETIALTRPIEAEAKPARGSARAGEITCDEGLFEILRTLRKNLADDRQVPAYVIFSDVTLRLMAREYPKKGADLLKIAGVGEKKQKDFGAVFLAVIQEFLSENPEQEFESLQSDPPPIAPTKKTKSQASDSAQETYRLYKKGLNLKEIVKQREMADSTILSHLTDCLSFGKRINLQDFMSQDQEKTIREAFAKLGTERLSPVKEMVGTSCSYGQLHLVRAAIEGKSIEG